MKSTIRKVSIVQKPNEIWIQYPVVSEIAWQQNLLGFYAVGIGFCILPIVLGLPGALACIGDDGVSGEGLYCIYLAFFYAGISLWAYLGFVRQFGLQRTIVLKPHTFKILEKEFWIERCVLEIERKALEPLSRVFKESHDLSTPGTSPHKLLFKHGRQTIPLISNYVEREIDLVQALYDGYRAGFGLADIVGICRRASGPFCWFGKGLKADTETDQGRLPSGKTMRGLKIFRARQIGTAVLALGALSWIGLWGCGPWFQMIGPIFFGVAIFWLFQTLRCPLCATSIMGLGGARRIICPQCGQSIGDKACRAFLTPNEMKSWGKLLFFPLLAVVMMVLVAIFVMIDHP